MTDLDLLYRAALDLRKVIRGDRALSEHNDAIVSALQKNKAFAIRSVCTIERDWVDAIDKGLVFIGKAIEEERQFIRSNGEVQPIEKVRHISRESVEHLARHSDFITRAQQNEDFVPDKLYSVERLNDYAVYENRFLYMLLCKLKDFVSLRYNQIVKITNSYYGELNIKKSVVLGKNKLDYEVSLKDKRQDDPFMKNNNSAKGVLEKLDEIQRSINFYLRTPLMIEVSKADKIKSKITKTNVLRMDKNFKETVELYEFIMAYNKDGYTITQEELPIDPDNVNIAQEFAFSAMLSSFLTYEHSLGIEDFLQTEYEKEEKRRHEEEQRLLVEQIKNLKKRVEAMGLDMEQYMLLLEKRNAELEDDHEKLKLARAEIEQLNTKIASMQEEIEAFNRKIVEMQESHKFEIKQLEEAHEAEITSLNEAHAQETEKLKADHEREIGEIRDHFNEEIKQREEKINDLNNARREAQEAHAREIEEINRQKREEIEGITLECNARIAQKDEYVAQKDAEVKAVNDKFDSLTREKQLSDARLLALRSEHGLLTAADDFKSEAAFNELERQYETLGKLVRSEWKGVKKMLRKELFDSIKGTMFKKKNSADDLNHFRAEGKNYTSASDDEEGEVAEKEEAGVEEE